MTKGFIEVDTKMIDLAKQIISKSDECQIINTQYAFGGRVRIEVLAKSEQHKDFIMHIINSAIQMLNRLNKETTPPCSK